MKTALVVGCSHTAGIGIEKSDCYVSVLSRILSMPIINAGVPSGNAGDCQQKIVHYVSNNKLEFIVAQWPNMVRRTIWTGDVAKRENIRNASQVFMQLLKQSICNYSEPWLQTIIVCNLIAKLANIPMINIHLGELDSKYIKQLNEHSIDIHVDEKQPGSTWVFDSAASDNLHHSAACHAAWADRILGILNENT